MRLPNTGGEKETLLVALNRQRDAVLWKLEGLGDEQVRRPMVPSGTSLLGLVKHLGGVEYAWFARTFGLETEPLETDPVEDMRARPHETTQQIVDFYRRACASSDAVIAAHDLDDEGTAWFGLPVNLRRCLVGMVEETARHAGHLDILREQLDGATGAQREHPDG